MPSYFSEFNLPKFMENYLTSNGGDYENAISIYAEPLPFVQEGIGLLFPDLVSSSPYGEGGVNLDGSPYGEGGVNLDGNGYWLSAYESYFNGWWGEDQFPHGYGVDTVRNAYGSGGWEKDEDPYVGEEQLGSGYYSSDRDIEMQPPYDYNPWSWTEYVGEKDYHDRGTDGVETAYSYSWDEMKLCESIFGHWPCLSNDNQETYVEQGPA